MAILHRNIRVLAIETYKNLQDLSLLILNEVFKERDCNYNLQINNFLNSWRVNSVRYGTKSVLFLAPKIWEILPMGNKRFWNTQHFQRKNKKNGFPVNVLVDLSLCPRRTYVTQIWFIWMTKIKKYISQNKLMSFSLAKFVKMLYASKFGGYINFIFSIMKKIKKCSESACYIS